MIAKFGIVAALALFLGGCVEGAARAVETGAVVATAVSERVASNLERRKQVRDTCWEMVQARVLVMRANGKYAEAEQLLRDRYPSLLTVRAVNAVIDGLEAGKAGTLPPDECGPEIDLPGFVSDGLPPQ